MKAEITLSYETAREAEAVESAVSPDNIEVPDGLFVETSSQKTEVFTRVECKTRLQTFIATIDDLLACASVAEKVFSTVKH